MSIQPLALGVLGSGKGSNFVALQEAIIRGEIPAQIRVVISDHAEAGILAQAHRFQLPALALPPSAFKTRLEPELEHQLVDQLRDYGVEWVILAGYMRVVKTPLLRAFPGRIINIHPSLLPHFKGLQAWKQALEAGVTETGCTVHLVNEEIDGGAILDQIRVAVRPGDTAETLHARIQVAEHRLLPEVLRRIAVGGLRTDSRDPSPTSV